MFSAGLSESFQSNRYTTFNKGNLIEVAEPDLSRYFTTSPVKVAK